MKVDIVSYGAIGDSWAKHGDVILDACASALFGDWAGVEVHRTHFVSPIIHRFLIVDFFPQTADHRARCPHFTRSLLLLQHGIQNGIHPVLEFAVVVVGNDEVPDAVHTSAPKICPTQVEVSQVSFAKALNKVLFNPSRSRHEHRDVFVLYKV